MYEPHYEEESGGGGFLIGLLCGTALGAAIGLMFAPKAGSEFRQRLYEQTGDIRRKAYETYDQASEQVNTVATKARQAVERGRPPRRRAFGFRRGGLELEPAEAEGVREAYRLCNKKSGVFSVVIPCEGSPAYTLARRVSAQRVFERRYKQSYHWFISREHINRPNEIMEELKPYFATAQRSFFPLLLPATACNLCIGLTLRPRKDAPRARA